MSKCEACGSDGQIEYGAYRGEEAGPTRECRLCGGAVTAYRFAADVVDTVDTFGASAQSASAGITRLAHIVSESGRRVTDLVITTEKLQTARDIAAERLEQLRQKNEQKQVEAERSTNDVMNELLRGKRML